MFMANKILSNGLITYLLCFERAISRTGWYINKNYNTDAGTIIIKFSRTEKRWKFTAEQQIYKNL